MKTQKTVQLLLLAASSLVLQSCAGFDSLMASMDSSPPPDAVPAVAPAAVPAAGPSESTVWVSAASRWQDSGISLIKGQSVSVTADGTVTYSTAEKAPNGGKCGPAGVDWGKKKRRVVEKWNCTALIARLVPVGDKQKKHLIGHGTVITANRDGGLQFRLNDTKLGQNAGNFRVIVVRQ